MRSILAAERIPDQPQAVTIQWRTHDFSGRDGLRGPIRGLFEVAQAAREQGPAGHRRGDRRQEHREPMKHRSRFDEHANVPVVHAREQLVSAQAFLPHPGEQAIKDTTIGAGKHLRLPKGEQEVELTGRQVLHEHETGRPLVAQTGY